MAGLLLRAEEPMYQLYWTTRFLMNWAGLSLLPMPPPKSGLGDIHCPLLSPKSSIKKLLSPRRKNDEGL